MADPGDSDSPCPAAVARATSAIVKRQGYRRDGADVSVRSRDTSASTVQNPHASLPPLAAQQGDELQLSIFRGGAFEAAHWLAEHGSNVPLVLDFASDSEPGGGWKGKQRGTQEEALCRQSSLGVRLEEHCSTVGAAAFMPPMSLVYVPDVVVFRAAENENYRLLPATLPVAVVAGALRSTTTAEITLKVQGVLRLAANKGHRVLVLGAWGCGAFGNDVEEVANIMVTACRSAAGSFDHVVFALPRHDEKLTAFIAAAPEAAVATRSSATTKAASKQPAAWELVAAEAELFAALSDHFEAATKQVELKATEIGSRDQAREAAQRLLRTVSELCLESLRGSVSEEVLALLAAALLEDTDQEVREHFQEAARPLVEEYFRALRRRK